MISMSWKHTAWALVFAYIIALVLFFLPAQAQELGGATSDSLYLAQISWRFPMWFTDAELQQAQRDAGYGNGEVSCG